MTYIEAPYAWGLARGMARVLGINLVDAVTEGWFSRHDRADMVDTCEVCGEARRCAAYLAVTPPRRKPAHFLRQQTPHRSAATLSPIRNLAFAGAVG